MARVFLTGGSGFIGGELATALLARGDEVIGLGHTDASARALAARGVRVVRGDVLDPGALAAGMSGCELVYHVAGINSHCPKDPMRLLRVNVSGTENVVRAAARCWIARVVVTSSAASIGEAKRDGRDRGLTAPRFLPIGIRTVQARERAGCLCRCHGDWGASRRTEPVFRPGPSTLRRQRGDHHHLPQRSPAGVRRYSRQRR